MKIHGIQVVDAETPIPVGANLVTDDRENFFTEAGAFKIKSVKLVAGDTCIQHIHVHPHATLVISGVIRVFVEDEDKGVYYPMEAIYVEAGKRHYMRAETDAMFACIHYIEE